MRFLCLHGRGTSAHIFKSQTASFRLKLESLAPDTTFEFIDAPFESNPALDVEPFYSAPYYTFWQGSSVPAIKDALDRLQAKLDSDGPYDGVLCFSQGCSLVASYLLYHEHSHPNTRPPFQLAVFICGGVPFSVLEDLGLPISSEAHRFDEGTRRLFLSTTTDEWTPRAGTWQVIRSLGPETSLFGLDLSLKPADMRIRIPTIHICGSKDFHYPAAVQLRALCEGEAPLWDHGGGHDIPRGKETSQHIAELLVKGMSQGEK